MRPAAPSTEARTEAPRSRTSPEDRPTLPDRAGEDTDEAWGQLPADSDDARLLADRPPHWQ